MSRRPFKKIASISFQESAETATVLKISNILHLSILLPTMGKCGNDGNDLKTSTCSSPDCCPRWASVARMAMMAENDNLLFSRLLHMLGK